MNDSWKHLVLVASVAVCLTALLTGCSSFNREWKTAARNPAPTNEITGAWDGSWLSDVNQHRGRLRCLLTRQGDNQYSARFKARFWKIFTAGYTVPLLVKGSTNGVTRLEGDSDLGEMAGGIYRYSAEVTSAKFQSTYRSKDDHGTFDLKRPE